MNLSKNKVKKLMKINTDWRARMIKEILLCKEGQLNLNLDEWELNILFENLCTN